MTWWAWVSAGYAAVGVVFWAIMACEIGRHQGKLHGGDSSPSCPEVQCRTVGRLCSAVFFFWPAFGIALICIFWTDFWRRAGSNSQLPPANGHPATQTGRVATELLEQESASWRYVQRIDGVIREIAPNGRWIRLEEEDGAFRHMPTESLEFLAREQVRRAIGKRLRVYVAILDAPGRQMAQDHPQKEMGHVPYVSISSHGYEVPIVASFLPGSHSVTPCVTASGCLRTSRAF